MPIALASYDHETADAIEKSGGLGYTGLKFHRDVVHVTLASCWPTYDTEWVWVPKDSGNWLEMNTDYRCIPGTSTPQIVTLFGHGVAGNWVEDKESTGVGTSYGDHVWNITMDYGGANNWAYIVDGATM